MNNPITDGLPLPPVVRAPLLWPHNQPNRRHMQRTYTVDELDELTEDPDTLVAVITGEELRWATEKARIFVDDGRLWQVTYYEAATEHQEGGWGYGTEPTHVEAIQVEPYEETVIRYRPVEETE